MYETTIRELIEILSKSHTPTEVFEYIQQLGEAMLFSPRQFSIDVTNLLENYAINNDICPECGSNERNTKPSYEDYDADNNRGRWVDINTCLNCGNEY